MTELMQPNDFVVVWINKSQLKALSDMGYRGLLRKDELQRAARALNGLYRPRNAYAVSLTFANLNVLVNSAISGRREHGLVEALQAMQVLQAPARKPQGRRSQKSEPKYVTAEDRKRQCVACRKMRPVSEFVGARGIRCVECRRRGVSVRPARVIRGGLPGLGGKR